MGYLAKANTIQTLYNNRNFQDLHLTNALSLYINDKQTTSLLNSMPVAVYICDADGRIVYYNDTAAKLWGYRPDMNDDLKFCACYKAYLPDGTFIPPEKTPMAVALATGQSFTNKQATIERPDGSMVCASININPLFDEENNITGAVNIFQDITEFNAVETALRKSEAQHQRLAQELEKATEQLRQNELLLLEKVENQTAELKKKNEELVKSEQRYHKMIEEVEDYAVLLLDRNGTIQNWNKGAAKIKGYTESEIVGRNFRIFYLPEDQQNNLPEKLIKEAEEKGKAIHEGWRVRKDGTVFWGSIVITALHDDDNEIIGFSKVTRDLTERKNAEDRIKHYAMELEFQNRELQQFAYAAAHDMKEPLRKIRFYNASLLESAASLLPDKEKKFLERSSAAALRMQRLIDDLLTYSKTSIDLARFEQVDLNIILADAASLHKETIEETGACLQIAQLPHVAGIAFQLTQLFENLLGNALKYRQESRTPRINIFAEHTVENSTHFIKIVVEDNGIGFDNAYSDKIFEMFQRLHGQGQYSGTGIGLALCKKIIQNHGGIIQASGNIGQGAVFSVLFPQV